MIDLNWLLLGGSIWKSVMCVKLKWNTFCRPDSATSDLGLAAVPACRDCCCHGVCDFPARLLVSAHPEMVDFGSEQGLSIFAIPPKGGT
jgi:hypothetical protein